MSKKCNKCSNLAVSNSILCESCQEKHRQNNKRYCEKRKNLGLCRCGKPALKKKTICEECKKKNRKRNKDLYESRKLAGLCAMCGEVGDGFVLCNKCKEKQGERNKDSRAKRILDGKCSNCGKKKNGEKGFCEKCSNLAKERNLRKRNARVEQGLCIKCGNKRENANKLNCDTCLEKYRCNNLKLKTKVINAYGGYCNCCGDIFIGRLTIDHVDNNGADHRRQLNNKGRVTLYQWLINNDYPAGFQVLCASCNLCKHIMGYCPHGDEYVKK